MLDRYLEFTHSALGKQVASSLGLPTPPRIDRADQRYSSAAFAGKTVLLAADHRAKALPALLNALASLGAAIQVAPGLEGFTALKAAAQAQNVRLQNEGTDSEPTAPLLVFDGTGLASAADLKQLHAFFQPRLRRLPSQSRVVILAQGDASSVGEATAAAALKGFVRSLAKEIGKNGSTANLLTVSSAGHTWLAGPLAFFGAANSAYVTGQVLAVTDAPSAAVASGFNGLLNGKVALVTGAARGIGAAIAQVLAREGATVVGMDRPAEEGALGATMAAINGVGLALDVTAADAPARLVSELNSRFGGADIIVHNAGVTRDKMLRNMSAPLWDMVLDINLAAILRINDALFNESTGGVKPGARCVCISSIGGISGNAGQTNYAATKAGVIGYAAALAPLLAQRGMAINAVAPGFIETQMTAAMPAINREVGRRVNSLAQGGLPQDIAEAVTFLGSPLALGINGETLRVCGQNWLGA